MSSSQFESHVSYIVLALTIISMKINHQTFGVNEKLLTQHILEPVRKCKSVKARGLTLYASGAVGIPPSTMCHLSVA